MANRYWVGGTGTWNTTSTTNWSASSGGAGGASVPTAADSVFFDQAGTYTVTMTGALTCLDFTGLAGTVTFATGTTPTLAVSGSFALAAGTVWSSTGTITFNATSGAKTVSTNGITLSAPITFSGAVATSHTLSSALTTTGAITITSGEFHTNTTYNYSVTASSIVMSGINAKLTLNGSTVTLSSTTPLDFTAATTPVLNFNYSTVVFTGAVTSFAPININVTFASVQFTNTTARTLAFTSTSTYTFGSLSIAAPAAIGVTTVTLAANIFTYGLSTTGTAGNRRVVFRSVNYGLPKSIFLNGSSSSIADADFRDIYVKGTNAPLTGTRIGDLGGCSGITFSAPKIVYCVSTTSASWSALAWSNTVGGAASSNYFPLAQDTATFVNTGLSNGATITWDTAIPYVGTVDMSARTISMTMNTSTTTITVYGNWKNGTGTLTNGSGGIVFSGRKTQTITSAGIAFVPGIAVDSYEGIVQLADAINVGSITVTNGTFNTNGYAVTAGSLSSNNSNIRTINLGASTVTLTASSGLAFATTSAPSVNLTFNAGTSTVIFTAHSTAGLLVGGGVSFNNVSFTATAALSNSFAAIIYGNNTYRNLTFTGPSTTGIIRYALFGNSTITETLTCTGGSGLRRIFLQSTAAGVTRTLTANALSATDCDFQDIIIAGAAAGTATTRTGDCHGNSGIGFPSPKTVYYTGTTSGLWHDNRWATTSGGVADAANFPLAQDTAILDANYVSGQTVTFSIPFNIGTVNTLDKLKTFITTFSPNVYGNFFYKSGGATYTNTAAINFVGTANQSIKDYLATPMSGPSVTVSKLSGVLSIPTTNIMIGALTITSGEFNALACNVSIVNAVNIAGGTLRMGSGTWNLGSTGTVWTYTSGTLCQDTANIELTDNTTTARTFAGGGQSYNKLTIGGNSSTSTTTITGNNQFTELASTKTVAHTIALGTTVQTFGKWSVTGTAGNVVTVTGTSVSHVIAGARVTGVDYLAMGSTGFSSSASYGEFYAGANSTGTSTTIIKTVAPAPVTRYWVGSFGTWDTSSTVNWSATSGGAGGASVPTSADAVVFDSASGTTAYTVTCTASLLRCGSLTMSKPASGNITWAGTAPLAIHGDVTLSATGITRTYTGAITLTGSTTGKTFTTNGVVLASALTVNGIGCGWVLGSALNIGGTAAFTLTNGSFDTSANGYTLSVGSFASSNSNSRSLTLNNSSVYSSITGTYSYNFSNSVNLVLDAGTSTLNSSASNQGIITNVPLTFYNYTFGISGSTITIDGSNAYYNVTVNASGNTTVNITGSNIFNNLTFAGKAASGIKTINLSKNQTVQGTLTFLAGSNPTMRTFVKSSVFGTARTITCNAVSATDVDFQDITIDGAAAPIIGTRLGDCKGNSGITFPQAKTVYYRLFGSGNWGNSLSWSFTNNGVADSTAFPLAQDTAVFPSTPTPYPDVGATVTVDAAYNIGTVDMSARTGNTMTLYLNIGAPTVYGNWINGTGTTISGSGQWTFAGRNAQTITSAEKPFTQAITIDSPGGSVTLQDAFSSTAGNAADYLNNGTFNLNGYSATFGNQFTIGAGTKTLNFGGGTLTVTNAVSNVWVIDTVNTTLIGPGTIQVASSTAKNFQGSSFNYSNITLNQGGVGALTITGNNTFKDITNSALGATSILLGSTAQTVSAFTATGASGKVLTISGTSAAAPATLILTGSTSTNVDYLTISNVRMLSKDTGVWNVGTHSTDNGSFGALFVAAVAIFAALGNFFAFF